MQADDTESDDIIYRMWSTSPLAGQALLTTSQSMSHIYTVFIANEQSYSAWLML